MLFVVLPRPRGSRRPLQVFPRWKGDVMKKNELRYEKTQQTGMLGRDPGMAKHDAATDSVWCVWMGRRRRMWE